MKTLLMLLIVLAFASGTSESLAGGNCATCSTPGEVVAENPEGVTDASMTIADQDCPPVQAAISLDYGSNLTSLASDAGRVRDLLGDPGDPGRSGGNENTVQVEPRQRGSQVATVSN